MPTIIERHNVLLSCPGDVDRLIPVIERVLNNFNEHYAESRHLELYLKHWSRDMYPKSGGKPQDLINQVVLPNCDAAIAVFWCRLGSPTDKYESGTVEEIEQMLESGRQVFLYFSNENTPYEVAKKGIDERIDGFKKRYKDKGVYWDFKTEEEFSRLLATHLRLHYIDQGDFGYKESKPTKDSSVLAALTQDECHYMLQAMKVDSVGKSLELHYERPAVNSLVRKGLLSLEKEQRSLFNTDLGYVLTPEGMRLAVQYGDVIRRLAHDPDLEIRLELLNGDDQRDE